MAYTNRSSVNPSGETELMFRRKKTPNSYDAWKNHGHESSVAKLESSWNKPLKTQLSLQS
jgi:hypothetical protein